MTDEQALADVAGPGLRVLFCGINPGLMSAARGQHFARPGNRFWPALHRSGFTPEQFQPAEQHRLLDHGIGITNVVDRPTARAEELTKDELVAGATRLAAKVRRLRPAWLAVVGVTAYRVAFREPRAVLGRQERRIGHTGVWVLPNPSGLNAHYTLDGLAAAFAEFRAATEPPGTVAGRPGHEIGPVSDRVRPAAGPRPRHRDRRFPR